MPALDENFPKNIANLDNIKNELNKILANP